MDRSAGWLLLSRLLYAASTQHQLTVSPTRGHYWTVESWTVSRPLQSATRPWDSTRPLHCSHRFSVLFVL